MAWTSAAEDAAKIRNAYKQHGWTGRDISVRADNFSMGSAIRVTVKNPAVPLPVAERIAQQAEHIHRDQLTGEILSGGNRYVSVSLTPDCERAKATPYIAEVKAAMQRLGTENTSRLEPCGHGYMVGRSNGWFSLWSGDGMASPYCTNAAEIAARIALAIEKQAAR